MISDSDMLDGINAVLAKNFTNYRVYVNLQKEDYERPSVTILSGSKKMQRETPHIIAREEEYEIIIKIPTDSAGIAPLTDMQTVQHKAAAAFALPVAVADRMLLPQVTLTPIEDNAYAEIRLSFIFYDSPVETAPAEDMEQINTAVAVKIKNKENVNGNPNFKYYI